MGRSLKLVRGSLDQVAETASISWVQPRVLDRNQIDGLRERLTACVPLFLCRGEMELMGLGVQVDGSGGGSVGLCEDAGARVVGAMREE